MLKLVIFDMDGVLVDSELYWKQFERELYPTIGIEFTKEVEDMVMGLKIADITKYIQKEHRPDITQEEVEALYERIKDKVYEHVTAMPGVVPLLEELQAADIPVTIGSSATASMIALAMKKSGLENYFVRTYSAGSMDIPGKPDPAIYTTIMKEMGAGPEATIIFEDSQHGFHAAVASGATVVAATDPRWCDLAKDYSAADLHVQSLSGVTLETLQSLIK